MEPLCNGNSRPSDNCERDRPEVPSRKLVSAHLLPLLLWLCGWETKSTSLALSHQDLLVVTSWRHWLYSLDQWMAFGTGAKSMNGNILPASRSDILLLLALLGRFVQLLCTS